MINFEPFEEKLALMRPRQLREIAIPEKTKTTSRNLWLRAKPFASPLAGFLLGVVVTYIFMMPRTPEPLQSVVAMPIDDTVIASLHRPMDLRHLASVRIVKEQPASQLPETEFQYRTLLLREIERQNR